MSNSTCREQKWLPSCSFELSCPTPSQRVFVADEGKQPVINVPDVQGDLFMQSIQARMFTDCGGIDFNALSIDENLDDTLYFAIEAKRGNREQISPSPEDIDNVSNSIELFNKYSVAINDLYLENCGAFVARMSSGKTRIGLTFFDNFLHYFLKSRNRTLESDKSEFNPRLIKRLCEQTIGQRSNDR